MKKYSKPEMIIQQFSPSEYIASSCITLYEYQLGNYTMVSISPTPVFDSPDSNGDGFVYANGKYKFVPQLPNYTLENGEPMHGSQTLTFSARAANKLQYSAEIVNHS